MNIVLATDDNFVQHCCVTITSILQHNTGVTFYVLTEGLSTENMRILHGLAALYKSELIIKVVDSDQVREFPMPVSHLSHISIATYYRLFVSFILPKDIDKVLYLDCDIVVRGSLEDLFKEDLAEYALGAVYQNNEWAVDTGSFERLSIDPKYGYFNAGVLMINLKYWREHDLKHLFFDYTKKRHERILFHDQDVLNAVLYDKVKSINYKWNYMNNFFDKIIGTYPQGTNYKPGVDPVVIHYVSVPKPWIKYCTHPFVDEYYRYLKLTEFRDFKPINSVAIFKKYGIRYYLKKMDVFNIRSLVRKCIG